MKTIVLVLMQVHIIIPVQVEIWRYIMVDKSIWIFFLKNIWWTYLEPVIRAVLRHNAMAAVPIEASRKLDSKILYASVAFVFRWDRIFDCYFESLFWQSIRCRERTWWYVILSFSLFRSSYLRFLIMLIYLEHRLVPGSLPTISSDNDLIHTNEGTFW